ncbi:peptidase M61 [Croceicoccus hydrothermalis]|uniref:M61 family metallopeptidase n=1 Tax=Croceicoccus hydrothermalis TaxID=2867964 RepID=UPI001EFBAD8B|nr:peptidase M61 [Croceicoccus hydrothermalis]
MALRNPIMGGAVMRAGGAILAALALFSPTWASSRDTGTLAIALTPADGDGDGIVDRMDVAITIADPPDAFTMKTLANNVPTAASDMTAPVFTRADAPVAARVETRQEDASNAVRLWHVANGQQAPLSIAYRVTLDPDRAALALPQYELRTGTEGFSGAALSFLILPDDDIARDVTIAWHLGAMEPSARALSSLGIGDVRSARPLRPVEIGSTYVMAGTPKMVDNGAFFAAWQGDMAFAGEGLMEWAGQLHRYYGEFFRHAPDSFGVFGRTNPLNPGSGIGLTDSFAFTFDESSTQADLKGLLAHEMLHAFVRSLGDTMDAAHGLSSAWFGEGLAVYYQRALPWRAGLIDDAAFLDDLNATAGRYYTNALIATPNDAIADGFWRDTRVRVLPYDRGSLYFAKLDADIRAASANARNLDGLVRAMLAERRAGGRWIRPFSNVCCAPIWARRASTDFATC